MGPPDPLQRGPKKLRDWLNALRRYAVSIQPVASDACDIHETPMGRAILPILTPGGAGGGSSSTFPWRASLTTDEDENDVVVVAEGRVFPTLDNPTPLALGLTFPVGTDPVEEGTKVFLLITYVDPADIATATFTIETSTDDWVDIDLVEWDEDPESPTYDKQTLGRIPICEVVAAGDALAVVQLARNDWWMSITVLSGRLADWPGAL